MIKQTNILSDKISPQDLEFLNRAILLGEIAGKHNLPIGAVIVLDDIIISEGSNDILYPELNPNGHAEINALKNLDAKLLLEKSKKMTLFTNIEPCLMCFGAIILNRIGRVVYGAADPNRGACYLYKHLGKIYTKEQLPVFVGPVIHVQDKCSKMWEQANTRYTEFKSFQKIK